MKGYPHKLKGKLIIIASTVVRILDVENNGFTVWLKVEGLIGERKGRQWGVTISLWKEIEFYDDETLAILDLK